MIDAVTSGIRAFAIDAAAKPTAWHCGIDSLPTTVKNGVMPILLRAIQKFYLYETSGLPFTHDMYLKRFEMGSGVSGEFDYLLVDEAQDLNPVLVSLVKKSRLPAIIVGDPFQSIYAWRGAVSAMKMFKGPTLPLSQSWRFGEDVARIANHLLNKTSDGLPRPVRGRPNHTTTVSHYPGRAPVGSFIIARTNARIFEGLVQMPRTFHVAGDSRPSRSRSCPPIRYRPDVATRFAIPTSSSTRPGRTSSTMVTSARTPTPSGSPGSSRPTATRSPGSSSASASCTSRAPRTPSTSSARHTRPRGSSSTPSF